MSKPVYLENDDEDDREFNEINYESENEVYYDKDIIVLANPEMLGLYGYLVMAGCVAAALSTAANTLVSTRLPPDLKKIINPAISDKLEINMRIASLGPLTIAAYFRINPPSSFVAKTVAFAFGLAASPFPTPLQGFSNG